MDAFKKITSDEYIKAICIGERSFADQCKLDHVDHEEVLIAILKTRLDETDERFK